METGKGNKSTSGNSKAATGKTTSGNSKAATARGSKTTSASSKAAAGKEEKTTSSNSKAAAERGNKSTGKTTSASSKATAERGNKSTNKTTSASSGAASERGNKTADASSRITAERDEKTTIAPDLGKELRKLAAKYDETDYRHWVPTFVADRLSKVEEIVEEFAPNSNILDSVVEFGRTTNWKADKKAIIRKAATTVGAASLQVIASAIAQKMKDQGDGK